MEYAKENRQPDRRKPYEAPAVRKVRLEVRASTLSLCLTSTGVSPSRSLCDVSFEGCFLSAPRSTLR
jgi:hypothetical protein